jgi:activating signal cointegrator 1
MKGFSLTQPWATLVVIGAKKIETRSWRTSYQGLIAIHASKGFPQWAKEDAHSSSFQKALAPFGYTSPSQLPTGSIVGVARIVECYSTDKDKWVIPGNDSAEKAFGDYSSGRFMWMLEDARMLSQPIPCRGALSLWDVPESIVLEIQKQLK